MKKIATAFALSAIAVGATMAMNDGALPVGMVQAQLVNPDGSPHGAPKVFKNLVTTAGKQYIASRSVDASANAIGWIAIGSNNTAPAVGQTALVTETARAAISSGSATGGVATFVATIPAGSGTGTVEEVGLFNASSAGTMVARALTGTITKPAGLGLQFTWTLTIS